MRGVVIALVVLVALVGVVVAWGALLPVGHVAAVRARFARPPAELYRAIADVAGAPAWRRGLESVQVLSAPGAPLRWQEKGRNGTITFVAEEATPPSRFVTRIDDPKLPFGGRWILEVRPAADGSELSVTEAGEVYNPLFRILSRYAFGYYGSLEQYVRDLGGHFGEPVTPERVAATSPITAAAGR